jgi:hypothetical protein
MEKHEKDWLDYSTKNFEPISTECDFCKRIFPNREVELVASWLFRINKLVLNKVKFKNVGMDICVECKIECLKNPDAFQFKIDLDLL